MSPATSGRSTTYEAVVETVYQQRRPDSHERVLFPSRVNRTWCSRAVAVRTALRGEPWIARLLGRHPALFDELLDPRTLYAPIEGASTNSRCRSPKRWWTTESSPGSAKRWQRSGTG